MQQRPTVVIVSFTFMPLCLGHILGVLPVTWYFLLCFLLHHLGHIFDVLPVTVSARFFNFQRVLVTFLRQKRFSTHVGALPPTKQVSSPPSDSRRTRGLPSSSRRRTQQRRALRGGCDLGRVTRPRLTRSRQMGSRLETNSPRPSSCRCGLQLGFPRYAHPRRTGIRRPSTW